MTFYDFCTWRGMSPAHIEAMTPEIRDLYSRAHKSYERENPVTKAILRKDTNIVPLPEFSEESSRREIACLNAMAAQITPQTFSPELYSSEPPAVQEIRAKRHAMVLEAGQPMRGEKGGCAIYGLLAVTLFCVGVTAPWVVCWMIGRVG